MSADSVPARGSWADELSLRVAAGPVPAALVYLTAWLILVAMQSVVQWAAGATPVGTFKPFHVFGLGLVVLLPWLIGVFNRRASMAMRQAANLVDGGPERVLDLEHRLVRAPAMITLLATVTVTGAMLFRVLVNPAMVDALDLSPAPALWIEVAVFAPLVGAAAAAFTVKIIHLGWQIHRITTREVRVDLWDLGGLSAFSAVTALMSGSFVALVLVGMTVSPFYSDPIGVGLGLTALFIAGAVFLLPLLGLHARIVGAKQLVQGTLSREMEHAIEDLRRAGATGELARIDPLNKQIGAIETAQRSVARVPTWPWEPELVRWLVGALLFPILLFVLQYVVARLLPD